MIVGGGSKYSVTPVLRVRLLAARSPVAVRVTQVCGVLFKRTRHTASTPLCVVVVAFVAKKVPASTSRTRLSRFSTVSRRFLFFLFYTTF